MTEKINRAKESLNTLWPDQAPDIISHCETLPKFNGITLTDFVRDHCTACGGDWCQMLLTGIRKISMPLYDLIPGDMGLNSFTCLCLVLVLLGVDFG